MGELVFDYGEWIWRNGQMVKGNEALTHVLTHGLHYGSGVYEGIRFYETDTGSAVFRLKDHMNRFHYSASVLDMRMDFSVEELCEATLKLVRDNGFSFGYIRPVGFYGAGKLGISPDPDTVDVAIACMPWGKYLSDAPISIGVSDNIRIHPKSLVCDAKINGHYVNSIMARHWAMKAGYDEGLLLDYQGNVAEGPGENIFLIKDGVLITPSKGNILPGLTRDTLMQLAVKELGMKVEERTVTVEDLKTADEAFFTGTAAEVTVIGSVDGIGVNGAICAGLSLRECENIFPLAYKLKDLYTDLVSGHLHGYDHWLSYLK